MCYALDLFLADSTEIADMLATYQVLLRKKSSNFIQVFQIHFIPNCLICTDLRYFSPQATNQMSFG